MIAGHFEEALQFVLGFDDRAEMVMVGEAQTALVDEAGDGVQPLAELAPFVGREPWVGVEPARAIPVHGVACFGEDEHRRAHRLEQCEMIRHCRDLGRSIAREQIGRIPAADNLETVALHDRLELRSVAREFIA